MNYFFVLKSDYNKNRREKEVTAMRILAVTACPVGIAHTNMAAENLQKAAEEMNVEIKIETKGTNGAENEQTEKEIEEEAGIIIASDKDIPKDRFIGKKVLSVGVQEGIRHQEELIKRVQSGDVPVYQPGLQSAKQVKKGRKEKGNRICRHLINGVSHVVRVIGSV